MARYTGPKARINRRFGAQLYESAGCMRAYEKRSEQPPGMHPKARRTSNYGTALSEKQKIKYYYGLGERQLRRYFDDAVRKKGNTGETLLLICERLPTIAAASLRYLGILAVVPARAYN